MNVSHNQKTKNNLKIKCQKQEEKKVNAKFYQCHLAIFADRREREKEGLGKTAEKEVIGKERAMIHRNSSQKERIHCKCENTEKDF